MKIYIHILLLLITTLLRGQYLAVENGVLFVDEGDVLINDIAKIEVNGSILCTKNSSFHLESSLDDIAILGSGKIEFENLHIYADVTQTIKEISASGNVYFNKGIYILDNSRFNIWGQFADENENSYMSSFNDGEIVTRFMSTKSNGLIEPANLGFSFTLPFDRTNSGVIYLKRIHSPFTRGGREGVLRTYSFRDNNMYAVDPKIEFFDSELNSYTFNELAIYGSNDFKKWDKITSKERLPYSISGSNILSYYHYTLFPDGISYRFPEGFSPNNDGLNDAFVVEGLTKEDNAKFTVYNRWGNKVYESYPYNNTWAGKSLISLSIGGDELPIGTYYYILEVKNDIFKGSVFLNR